MPGNISPPITLEILKRERNFLLFFAFLFAFLWNAKVGNQEIPGVTASLALEYKMKQGKV